MAENEVLTNRGMRDALAERTGLSKKACREVLNAIFGTDVHGEGYGIIPESLLKGQSVQFIGFGTFTLRVAAKRTVTQINGRKPLTVKAHTAIRFKPSKGLKLAVRPTKLA